MLRRAEIMAKKDNILFQAFLYLLILNISESDPRIDEFVNDSNLVEYQYRYSVDESQSKGPVMDRWEHRIGEYVKGAYSVLEPDGRIRTVDYEVDGGKGYHAVIRMNEPGPELLSYLQLQKSAEVFPEANLPVSSFNQNGQTRNARNEGKIWNYHSRSPYLNDVKSDQRDHRGAATSQISRMLPPDDWKAHLPLSPANFNVPQSKKLIHFLKPAGIIHGKRSHEGKKKEEKEPKRFLLTISDGKKEDHHRKLRHSKMMKRLKSEEKFHFI